MKKLIVAIALLVFFGVVSPAFTQTVKEDDQSEYYYVNIPVEKIYMYKAGYIVQYRQGINKLGTLYLPNKWFADAAGKGELVWIPRGNEWPTMTVYYKEGEFSHLRLYIHRWKGHQTWGIVPLHINIDDRFENVETLDIEF